MQKTVNMLSPTRKSCILSAWIIIWKKEKKFFSWKNVIDDRYILLIHLFKTDQNISFDIFQSKWYRNALIGVPKIVFAVKAFRYHFDWKMSKQIEDVSFLTINTATTPCDGVVADP